MMQAPMFSRPGGIDSPSAHHVMHCLERRRAARRSYHHCGAQVRSWTRAAISTDDRAGPVVSLVGRGAADMFRPHDGARPRQRGGHVLDLEPDHLPTIAGRVRSPSAAARSPREHRAAGHVRRPAARPLRVVRRPLSDHGARRPCGGALGSGGPAVARALGSAADSSSAYNPAVARPLGSAADLFAGPADMFVGGEADMFAAPRWRPRQRGGHARRRPRGGAPSGARRTCSSAPAVARPRQRGGHVRRPPRWRAPSAARRTCSSAAPRVAWRAPSAARRTCSSASRSAMASALAALISVSATRCPHDGPSWPTAPAWRPRQRGRTCSSAPRPAVAATSSIPAVTSTGSAADMFVGPHGLGRPHGAAVVRDLGSAADMFVGPTAPR